jgi:hypothetical protein
MPVPIASRNVIAANRSSDPACEPTEPAAFGPLPGRRPWWIWATPFALMLTVLLVRNAFLFSTPEYESSDMGANSILIEQARRFTLLFGNYSREGFNHPGPAFLYVESWGEQIFWAMLRVVPTAWNGQVIGLYILNAGFAACVVAVTYGWMRSVRGALAAGAVLAVFGVMHPAVFNSDWMPYVYVPAFLTFVVSLASVFAGRSGDAWILALSGWFLIHGHAAFLFIVPSMVAIPVIARTWPKMRAALNSTPASEGQDHADDMREFWREILARRRIWLPVVIISAVFALPLILQWELLGPGNFRAYFTYQSSGGAGVHTLSQVTDYVLWFWWPHANAWAVPLILAVAAGGFTFLLPAGSVRRFCWSLVIFDALASGAVAAYALIGVDDMAQYYICYFSWSNAVVLVLVIAIAVAELIASAGSRKAVGGEIRGGRALSVPGLAAFAVTAAAALAAGYAFAAAPATTLTTVYVDPENPAAGNNTDAMLPTGVAKMGALADGRVIVLTFTHGEWTTVTGILAQGERSGVRACVADPYWRFMMTSQFICTPAQLAGGYPMAVYPTGAQPRGVRAAAQFEGAIATQGVSDTSS